MEYMPAPQAAEKWGISKKAGTDTFQREPHTGRFKTWISVADAKRRKQPADKRKREEKLKTC